MTNTAVTTRELSERPFQAALVIEQFCFYYHFCAGKNIQAVAGLGEVYGAAHHLRSIGKFRFIVIDGGGGKHGHGRVVTEHHCDLQRDIVLFRHAYLLRHIVGRNGQQGELVRSLDLDTVNPHVLLGKIIRVAGVAADDIGLGDIKTAIQGIDAVQRQHVIQVYIRFNPVFVHWCVIRFHPVYQRFVGSPTTRQFVEQFLDAGSFRFAQQQGYIGKTAVHPYYQSLAGITTDIVEHDSRPGHGVAARRDDNLTYIGFRQHGFGPGDALAVFGQQFEIIA